MKHIIFIENIDNGGLNTFCATLINHWHSRNDEIVLICNNSHPGKDNLVNSINNLNCKIVFHKIPISWAVSKNFFFLPSILRKSIKQLLRVFLFPIQFIALKELLKKNIADEVFVINGGYPGGETCRIVNIAWYFLTKKKSIHNFHNYAVKPRLGFGWFENFIDYLTIKSCKSFISVSKSCSSSIFIRKQFKDLNNIFYIYNGIKTPEINRNNSFRNSLNIKNDGSILVMLGNYELRKGHEFILKAFSKVRKIMPNTHLIFAGGGNKSDIETQNFIELVEENPNHIHFLNFVTNNEDLINESDVLLIGSQSFESFGLTAVEAMFLKKPIVSTNTGGLEEVIGDCGLIVPKDSPDVFADSVLNLLKDDQLRIELGRRGADRANKLFTANRMCNDYYEKIYN